MNRWPQLSLTRRGALGLLPRSRSLGGHTVAVPISPFGTGDLPSSYGGQDFRRLQPADDPVGLPFDHDAHTGCTQAPARTPGAPRRSTAARRPRRVILPHPNSGRWRHEDTVRVRQRQGRGGLPTGGVPRATRQCWAGTRCGQSTRRRLGAPIQPEGLRPCHRTLTNLGSRGSRESSVALRLK